MTTLTGTHTRTIVGYVLELLDYPRWVIARDIDFTNCHLGGRFDATDEQCSSCRFGAACCWLNGNRPAPANEPSLDAILHALSTSIEFVRSSRPGSVQHPADCDCDSCDWLRESRALLRQYRNKT